jgi:hypothetical protein
VASKNPTGTSLVVSPLQTLTFRFI